MRRIPIGRQDRRAQAHAPSLPDLIGGRRDDERRRRIEGDGDGRPALLGDDQIIKRHVAESPGDNRDRSRGTSSPVVTSARRLPGNEHGATGWPVFSSSAMV